MRETLGLNDPIHIQFDDLWQTPYVQFWKILSVAASSFELIAERMPATLELVIASSILALGFGVFLGVYTGINRTGIQATLSFVSLAGVSLPIRDWHPANLYLCNFGILLLRTWRRCADRFLEYGL